MPLPAVALAWLGLGPWVKLTPKLSVPWIWLLAESWLL